MRLKSKRQIPCFFLDSDDIWNNKKIEKQIDFMLNRNIAFSFTSYQPINKKRGEKYIYIVNAPEKLIIMVT